VELKKEAEFFADIVFVPYLDNYDLVVTKTLAICEYGDLAYDSLHCCLAVNIFSYLGSMIAFYGQLDQYSCCRVPHLTSQHYGICLQKLGYCILFVHVLIAYCEL